MPQNPFQVVGPTPKPLFEVVPPPATASLDDIQDQQHGTASLDDITSTALTPQQSDAEIQAATTLPQTRPQPKPLPSTADYLRNAMSHPPEMRAGAPSGAVPVGAVRPATRSVWSRIKSLPTGPTQNVGEALEQAKQLGGAVVSPLFTPALEPEPGRGLSSLVQKYDPGDPIALAASRVVTGLSSPAMLAMGAGALSKLPAAARTAVDLGFAGSMAKDIPISPVQQATRIAEGPEGSLKRFAWGMAGVRFPRSAAEQEALQISSSKAGTGAWTPQERKEYYARQRAIEGLRKGDSGPLDKALKEGTIRPDQTFAIRRRARMTWLQDKVHGFTWPEIERVYEKAKAEKDVKAMTELLPMMREKRQNYMERRQYYLEHGQSEVPQP